MPLPRRQRLSLGATKLLGGRNGGCGTPVALNGLSEMLNKAMLPSTSNKPGLGRRQKPGWGCVPGALKTTRRVQSRRLCRLIFSLQNGAGNASPSGALQEACAGSVRKTIKCQTNRRLAELFLPPGRQAGD